MCVSVCACSQLLHTHTRKQPKMNEQRSVCACVYVCVMRRKAVNRSMAVSDLGFGYGVHTYVSINVKSYVYLCMCIYIYTVI